MFSDLGVGADRARLLGFVFDIAMSDHVCTSLCVKLFLKIFFEDGYDFVTEECWKNVAESSPT